MAIRLGRFPAETFDYRTAQTSGRSAARNQAERRCGRGADGVDGAAVEQGAVPAGKGFKPSGQASGRKRAQDIDPDDLKRGAPPTARHTRRPTHGKAGGAAYGAATAGFAAESDLM